MSAPLAMLPPPDVAAVYVMAPQGQLGPLSLNALLDQVSRGQIPHDAPVWFEGLAGWIRMGEHPELRQRLAAGGASQAAPPDAPWTTTPSDHAAQPSDDEQDLAFTKLVKESWRYFERNLFASHVDEVFIGAVITSTLDNGYALIDITSDGSNHYLRFENLDDKSRIIYQLHHLASDAASAKVMGHISSVIIGYGERVGNIGQAISATQAEFKSGYLQSAEPGTITIDADMGTGYVYTQVDMYWNISDYVSEDYAINYDLLRQHVGASIHALRKFLRGRIS